MDVMRSLKPQYFPVKLNPSISSASSSKLRPSATPLSPKLAAKKIHCEFDDKVNGASFSADMDPRFLDRVLLSSCPMPLPSVHSLEMASLNEFQKHLDCILRPFDYS